jgi:hypothetical protein
MNTMKRILFGALILSTLRIFGQQPCGGGGPQPPSLDPNFIAFLKKNYLSTVDPINNRIIDTAAAKVIGAFNCSNSSISSLEGIQYFKNISSLYAFNNNLTSLPILGALMKLDTLDVHGNRINCLPPFFGLNQLVALDVSQNQLSNLPNLDNLSSLESFDCSSNKLTYFGSVANNPNLKRLNVSNNKISNPLDFTSNRRLTSLNFSNNNFTEFPHLDSLDSLKTVGALGVNYTFRDLYPYHTMPNFNTVFQLPAKRELPNSGGAIPVAETQTVQLSVPTDSGVPGMVYSWYYGKNTNPLSTSTFNSLSIASAQPSQSGNYYCVLSNTNFQGITLYTDTFKVTVKPCIDVSDFYISNITEINCSTNGSATVKSISPTSGLKYQLKSPVSGSTFTSETGIFKGLSEPRYRLTISSGSTCQKEHPDDIIIPSQECLEAYMTPDNDGDKDTYFFSQTGNVKIYDAQGILVKTLTAPTLWDGSSKSSSKVASGYYVADVNNGTTLVKITVAY